MPAKVRGGISDILHLSHAHRCVWYGVHRLHHPIMKQFFSSIHSRSKICRTNLGPQKVQCLREGAPCLSYAAQVQIILFGGLEAMLTITVSDPLSTLYFPKVPFSMFPKHAKRHFETKLSFIK